MSLHEVSNLDLFCGGSLIAPDIVLTSELWCSRAVEDIAVRINPHSLSNPSSDAELLPVVDKLVHPQLGTMGGASPYSNDVVLLKLGASSIHAPVAVNSDVAIPTDGQILQTAGWGLSNFPSRILLVADQVHITNEQCVQQTLGMNFTTYEEFVSSDAICVDTLYTRACTTDRGTCICSGIL